MVVFLWVVKRKVLFFCIDGKRTSLIQTPCGISRSICSGEKRVQFQQWVQNYGGFLLFWTPSPGQRKNFLYNCNDAPHGVNTFFSGFSFAVWPYSFGCLDWNISARKQSGKFLQILFMQHVLAKKNNIKLAKWYQTDWYREIPRFSNGKKYSWVMLG